VLDGLNALLLVRGVPTTIACDNGPEFVSLALNQWASARGIRLDFFRPCRLVEHCFIKSFNGRLRDECLNLHHFTSLAEARREIAAWWQEYNTARPRITRRKKWPHIIAARSGTPHTDSDRAWE